jgi:Lrp/AsnC family transcriptional regulator
VIGGSRTEIDLELLGFDLTAIVMIRTRHHSKEWSEDFRKHVDRLPEVIDFFQIGGDWEAILPWRPSFAIGPWIWAGYGENLPLH